MIFFLSFFSCIAFNCSEIRVYTDTVVRSGKRVTRLSVGRILSYLDVVSLCRCAQVSKAWNVLALDGSNWQRIDLFDFQRDVEVNRAI